ncbi:MAG: response regulator transcription factor [Anaerolineales bacterium]|nr:response regulator transcription factor [Anaerolineales bacterium]
MTAAGHILIIDDEASIRKTLARILQQAGFEATTAESAEQGLDYLRGSSFDLIFTDLRMPGMHGMDALKVIHAEYPALPVVLFTAQPDINSALDALRHGATDYLLKPIKPQAIIERTRAILEKSRLEKRKQEILVQIETLQNELKDLDGETPRADSVPQPPAADKERFLKRGVLVLDLRARRATVGEKTFSPPPTSFDYLLALARHSPDAVDYQTLVAEAQGYQTDLREAQELSKWHIHQLRQLLEADARNPTYLLNVRGIGYRLIAD